MIVGQGLEKVTQNDKKTITIIKCLDSRWLAIKC